MRIAENLIGVTLFNNLAKVNNSHAVADFLSNSQRVRDDNQGNAQLLVDLLQQIQDSHRRTRIKRARCLIAKHDLRPVCQCARNGHTLLLAARKLAGITVLVTGHPHRLKKLARTLLALLPRLFAELKRKCHVLQDGTLLKEAEMLENHANTRTKVKQILTLIVRHVLAVNDNRAGSRSLKQINATNQR